MCVCVCVWQQCPFDSLRGRSTPLSKTGFCGARFREFCFYVLAPKAFQPDSPPYPIETIIDVARGKWGKKKPTEFVLPIMRSSSHQLHFTSFYISTSRSTIARFIPSRKSQRVSTFWKISLVFVSSIYLTFLPFYFLLHNGVWSRTRESCLEALGGFAFGCYISLLPAFMSAGSLPTQYVVGSWWRWVLLDPCGDYAFVFWSVDSICWRSAFIGSTRVL